MFVFFMTKPVHTAIKTEDSVANSELTVCFDLSPGHMKEAFKEHILLLLVNIFATILDDGWEAETQKESNSESSFTEAERH
jgi:hypothetical protein